MPDLAGDAEPASQQPPTQHDAAADPGADGEDHDMILITPGTEPRLRPRGRVRVVLDHHREVAASLDRRPQGLIAPRQVRGEQHRGPLSIDEAGRADAYRLDVM